MPAAVIGLGAILVIKSKGRGPHGLLLGDQGKEKVPASDSPAELGIRSVGSGSEFQVGRIGRVYKELLQKLHGLGGHKGLQQDARDTKGFSRVEKNPLLVGFFPRLRCMKVPVGLVIYQHWCSVCGN